MILDKKKFLYYHGRSAEESRNTAEFVKRIWQAETEHRVRIANEVTEHMFLFDLPWDMERTVETVDFGEKIDWYYMPGDDPEFIYQLNRHRYWICLGQAYQLTGDEKYVKAFVNQLTDWIESCPFSDETKPTVWRSIEAGLRGENWIKAMGYMAESPLITEEVWDAFAKSLLLHAEYISSCDEVFNRKSNWGVLESNGLYSIGKMLEGCGEKELAEKGAQFAKLALTRLERQIKIQVMDDGVHWEQSPMYHNEVLKCYMEVLRVALKYEDTVSETIRNGVKAMAYADRMWQRPDGCQPMEGDSDRTDLRDVMSVCALLFHDSVLKSGGYDVLDYEGAWDYGMEKAEEYRQIEAVAPTETFTWLKESGNMYLRSGWDEKADYMHLRCGALGGGHGHFDKTHFELMINGEEVLTDVGRYTYVDGAERYRFKSAKAHNVMTVDGEEYTKCENAWGVSGLPLTVPSVACQKKQYTYMQCGHLGYMEKGVLLNRKIIAAGTKAYIIADEFYGAGKHTYRQHFHLAAGKKAVAEEKNAFVITGERYQVKIICLSDGVTSNTEEFGVSSHYNQLEDGEMITFEKTAEGNGCMLTAVLCTMYNNDSYSEKQTDKAADLNNVNQQELWAKKVPVISPAGGRTLSDREADGVSFGINGTTYAAVFSHVDMGADCEYIGCEEKYGLGRVMICEKDTDETMTILSWQ